MNALALLALVSLSASAFAGNDDVKQGELKCYYIVGQTNSASTLTDVSGLGTPEIERDELTVAITVPRVCLKNPEQCEGGPIRTAELDQKRKSEGKDVRLILNYGDGDATAEIRVGDVGAYSPHLRLQYGDGPALQIGDRIYTFTCSKK